MTLVRAILLWRLRRMMPHTVSGELALAAIQTCIAEDLESSGEIRPLNSTTTIEIDERLAA